MLEVAPPVVTPASDAVRRGGDPARQPQRLRRTAGLRALVRETRLHPAMLVAPLFVQPGRGRRTEIG